MKSLITLAALAVAACWTSTASAATAAADHVDEMKECAVCSVMAGDGELMKHMTWEIHKIGPGMLCITSVPADLKDSFDAAGKKMMETVAGLAAKFQAGEQVKLCSFCQAMAELMQAGAKQESVDTKTGSILIVSSTDPAVIEKIHAHADKFNEAEAAAH